MRSRRHATKPTIALWTLVAIGDAALILGSVGLVALIALASVVAVAAVGAWPLLRRGLPDRDVAPVTTRPRARTASQLR